MEDVKKKKPNDWISAQGWKDLLKLATLDEVFFELPDQLSGSEKAWKDWYDLEAPEIVELPFDYSEKLTSFQQLLLMRCF